MNTTQHNRPTRYGTIPPRLLTESTGPHAGEGRRRRRLERKRQAGCGNKQRTYADGPEGERTGGDAMQAKPRWKKRSPGGVTTPESLPLDHHGDRPASSVTPRPTSPDENEMLGKAVPARRRASLTYPCRAPEGGSIYLSLVQSTVLVGSHTMLVVAEMTPMGRVKEKAMAQARRRPQ